MKNTREERQFAGCETVKSVEVVLPVPAPVTSGGWLKRGFAAVHQWNERRISRNILNALSAEQLKDIGLSRGDIEKEYPKSVWPNWPK